MRKVGIIISIVLNVLLLVGIYVVHVNDTKNCSKSEPTPSTTPATGVKKIHCEKDSFDDFNDPEVFEKVRSVVEIESDSDGVVKRLVYGTLVTYKQEEVYQSVLKDNNKNNSMEDKGNKTVYLYVDGDVEITNDKGEKHSLWVVNILENYQGDGYTCK